MKMRKAGLLVAGLGTVSVLAMAAALSSVAAPTTSATEKVLGSRVDNFMLADQTGLGHELYYFKDRKAIVIASVALGDKASERALAELAKLKASHDDKLVKVYAINSAIADTRETIEAKYAGSQVPILDDELQLVGRALGVTTTSEAFVVDPKTWKVVYHGPIDKSFAAKSGGKGSVAAAVDALIAGGAPQPIEAAVKGAKIDFPARKQDFATISYANDVAPIIGAKCVSCHVEGGMGPFKMDRYETVKGFSPMIREVLRTNRMPPFHSDNHGMKWSNEMRLTDAEKLKMVNWIEAGSPRGEGADPLPALQKAPPKWPLGQPDAIVDVPSFDVPASGIVDYQDRSVATNFSGNEGKWLRATAWAGASASVHHALAGWIPEVRADGKGFSWNTSLGGYGPGGEANLTPPDTGIWVPAGGSYAYQMHYTTTGKAMTDKTQAGYYFYKTPPKYMLRQISVTDFSIEIPAGAERWHETAYLEFPHDAIIFGTQPHCHSRCYSTKLRIRYPDGKEKLVLNQARYEFSWQREYLFEPMLEVPAGSLLIADYIFDNSVNNASNPDPKKNVTFGEQTSEEMLFTFARFRWKDETVENRRDDWMKDLQQNVTFGAFDDDIDGKITVAEIRNDPRFSPLKQYIGVVDKDKDGALSKVEFKAALQMMSSMRRPAPKADKAVEEMTNGGSGNAPAQAPATSPKKAN